MRKELRPCSSRPLPGCRNRQDVDEIKGANRAGLAFKGDPVYWPLATDTTIERVEPTVGSSKQTCRGQDSPDAECRTRFTFLPVR